MRKIYLFLFFASIVFSTVGQTRSDQAIILKMCLDLPELQSYFSKDSEEGIEQITIGYWDPILFPTDLELTKNGKNVIFTRMSSLIERNDLVYILFLKFEIQEMNAKVSYEYNYLSNNCNKKLLINLDLVNQKDTWKVLSTSIKNQE